MSASAARRGSLALGLVALIGIGGWHALRTDAPEAEPSSARPRPERSRPRRSSAALPPPRSSGAITQCQHPYLPRALGSARRYVVRAGAQALSVSFTLEVEEPAEDGTILEWRLDVALPPAPARNWRVRTRCDAAGAEVPWFPLQLRLAGIPPEVTLILPRRLALGTEVSGEASVALAGRSYSVSRQASVAGLEPLAVAAGSFSTVRLEVHDESRFDDEHAELEGTEWVAEGVGLVRYEQRTDGRLGYELELVEADGD